MSMVASDRLWIGHRGTQVRGAGEGLARSAGAK